MPEGFIFGLIDNGVLAFATILGIDIDKYFKGSGVHGAIYGALIGNSLSDFLGAILDFPLMTAININRVAEPYIQRRAMRHLEKGRVVIFAAGTGNPYFTTDTAAVLRASEVGAEIVIKATKIDGVYDKDPKLHSDAVRYDMLNYDEVLKKHLKVMDATAIAFCRDNQLPILVLDYQEPDAILRAVCGETVGTLIKQRGP